MDETRQEKPTRRVETWTPDSRYLEFFGRRGYKILGPAGNKGGESSTFLAEKEGQKYVLKLYRSQIKPDREVFWELRQQQEAAQRYFPRLYEHGEVPGTHRFYEVWEYISEGSLRNLIRKLSDFTERKEVFREVIRQISEALHLLHERDIIHRDLKPSNILIRRRNPLEMVLIDFGISRKLAPDATQHYTTHFKGTRMYSAPEESSPGFGKEVDWWHLGIIGYEILLGKNPFDRMSDMVILNKLSTEDIAIPSEVEEPERRLLLGLLTRDPKKRWGYAAIQKWLHGEKDIPVYRGDAPASPQTSRKRTYTLEDWKREGFTEHSYKLWESLGLSPSEARSFDKNRFGVDEARPWVEAGFRNGERCREWIKEGFNNPEEVSVYESFGLSIDQAKNLKRLGFSALYLSPYRGDIQFMQTLKDTIKHLQAEGLIPSLKEVIDYCQQVNPQLRFYINEKDIAALLKERTVEDINALLKKYQLKTFPFQISPEEVVLAVSRGMSPQEIGYLRKANLTIKEYFIFREQNIKIVEKGLFFEGGEIRVEESVKFTRPLRLRQAKATFKGVTFTGLHIEDSEVALHECIFSSPKKTQVPMLTVERSRVRISACQLDRQQNQVNISESSEVYIENNEIAIPIEVTQAKLHLIRSRLSGSARIRARAAEVNVEEVSGSSEAESVFLLEANTRFQIRDLRLEKVQTALQLVNAVGSIEKLHIQSGNRGIYLQNALLTLRKASISDLSAEAIVTGEKSLLRAVELSLENNSGRTHILARGATRLLLARAQIKGGKTGLHAEGIGRIYLLETSIQNQSKTGINLSQSTLIGRKLHLIKNSSSRGAQISATQKSILFLSKTRIEKGAGQGIFLSDSTARLKEVEISENHQNAIEAQASNLRLRGVTATKNGGIYQMVIEKCSLMVEKLTIEGARTSKGGLSIEGNMKTILKKCVVRDHAGTGLYADSSTLNIIECIFSDNGKGIESLGETQISVSNAKMHIKNCQIMTDKSSNIGIWIEGGVISLEDVQIENHQKNGILVQNSDEITIESCQFIRNGSTVTDEYIFPAIFLKGIKSKTSITNTLIAEGSSGLYIEGTNVQTVKGIEIHSNRYYAMRASQAQVRMEDVKVYQNLLQKSSDCYQIELYGTRADISRASVYGALRGILIDYWRYVQSECQLNSCAIHDHREYGLVIKERNELLLRDSRLLQNAQNRDTAQMVVAGKATLERVEIIESAGGGIMIDGEGGLALRSCVVKDNKAYDLMIKDRIEIQDTILGSPPYQKKESDRNDEG